MQRGKKEEQLSKVLISTYWNVNLEKLRIVVLERHVLISTYWNVNEKSS